VAATGVLFVAVSTTLGKVAILGAVGRSPFAVRVSLTLLSLALLGVGAVVVLHGRAHAPFALF
jgi:hypothetical protein